MNFVVLRNVGTPLVNFLLDKKYFYSF